MSSISATPTKLPKSVADTPGGVKQEEDEVVLPCRADYSSKDGKNILIGYFSNTSSTFPVYQTETGSHYFRSPSKQYCSEGSNKGKSVILFGDICNDEDNKKEQGETKVSTNTTNTTNTINTPPTRSKNNFKDKHNSACLVGYTSVAEKYQPVYESGIGKFYYLNSADNKIYCSEGSNKFVDVCFFPFLDAEHDEDDEDEEEEEATIKPDPDAYLKADDHCTIKDVMKELRAGRILTPPLIITSFGGHETSNSNNTDLQCLRGASRTEHAKAKNNKTMEIIEHLRRAKDEKRDLLFDRQEIYKDFEFLDSIGFRQRGNKGVTPNGEWKPLYKLAQRAAPLALFFFSHRSVASKNCKLEIKNYQKMRKRNAANPDLKHKGMIVALHKEGAKAKGFARPRKMYNQLLELKNHDYFDEYFAMHSGSTNNFDSERKRLVQHLIQLKKEGMLVSNMTGKEYTDEVINILSAHGY